MKVAGSQCQAFHLAGRLGTASLYPSVPVIQTPGRVIHVTRLRAHMLMAPWSPWAAALRVFKGNSRFPSLYRLPSRCWIPRVCSRFPGDSLAIGTGHFSLMLFPGPPRASLLRCTVLMVAPYGGESVAGRERRPFHGVRPTGTFATSP